MSQLHLDDNFRLHNDLGFHRISDQTVLLRGSQRTPHPSLDDRRGFIASGHPDHGTELQAGENLGAVEFDQFRPLGAALVGEQVELKPFRRPNEHQHHAGVRGSDEGILRREHVLHVLGHQAAARTPSPGHSPSRGAPNALQSNGRSCDTWPFGS